MDSVFVTGGNSLLGTNLIVLLIEKGFAVKTLVRVKSSFVRPDLPNLTIIEGDIQNTDILEKGIKGCRYVVHIAANTSQSLLKPKDYYATNVEGTKNVIETSIKNSINKLVYIGTANTFGYGNASAFGNESRPMKAPFTNMPYALSKKQVQDVIDEASSRLNITTISPTFMLGAYDNKPTSGRIILRAIDKKVLLYPPGGKSFVHALDVALAIINAFKLKESHQKFIIANENLSYKAFYEKVLLISNQKTRLLPVPKTLLQILGLFGDVCRFFKIKTDIFTANTQALSVNNFFSNEKAKKELGIDFTPIDKAIQDTLEYLNRNKK